MMDMFEDYVNQKSQSSHHPSILLSGGVKWETSKGNIQYFVFSIFSVTSKSY